MILDVDGVVFAYNSHPVLRNMSFQVRAGELLAILGPNGVGKTTLLKCVNAIHRPRGGAVRVEGRDLLRMAPAEISLAVGYVPQRSEPARLTVFDAVLMGRKPHIRWRTSPRDLSIVDAALKHLGLKPLSLRSIDTLSGGELQKVAIARALVQEPRLLLLDEPTSSLDLKNQMDILSLVRRVVDEHAMAAVMTMHDLNAALRFAHKFLFLKDGAIYAAGDCKDVTAEMVEEVYGLPVEIHQINGRPMVAPLA
ncbi:MAG: iron complex transport system ATP-binding protein [Desulfovibrionales bacterium]|nr:iron complex transport system ATP-binding protein [Desulfovibrionales bacterium]